MTSGGMKSRAGSRAAARGMTVPGAGAPPPGRRREWKWSGAGRRVLSPFCRIFASEGYFGRCNGCATSRTLIMRPDGHIREDDG